MNELDTAWITHRMPKASDAYKGVVWVTRHEWTFDVPWRAVMEGEPWQPIYQPAPYIEPVDEQQ